MKKLLTLVLIVYCSLCFAKSDGHWKSLSGPSTAFVGPFYATESELFVQPSPQLTNEILRWNAGDHEWTALPGVGLDPIYSTKDSLYTFRHLKLAVLRADSKVWEIVSDEVPPSTVHPGEQLIINPGAIYAWAPDWDGILKLDGQKWITIADGLRQYRIQQYVKVGKKVTTEIVTRHVGFFGVTSTPLGLFAITPGGFTSDGFFQGMDVYQLKSGSQKWELVASLPEKYGHGISSWPEALLFVDGSLYVNFPYKAVMQYTLKTGHWQNVSGGLSEKEDWKLYRWRNTVLAETWKAPLLWDTKRHQWLPFDQGLPRTKDGKIKIEKLYIDGANVFATVRGDMQRYSVFMYDKQSWRLLGSHLPSSEIAGMEISDIKMFKGDVVASLSVGIYMLKKGETEWLPMNSGLWPMSILKIAADEHNVFANGLLFGLGGYVNCATFHLSKGAREWALLTNNYGLCAEKLSIENGTVKFDQGRIFQETLKKAKNKLGVPGVKKIFVDYTSPQGVRYVGTDRGVYQWVQ